METARKNSRKRQAIFDALYASHEHPTAEMLYKRLKPEYPELSLGTVYRNLTVLTQEGLVNGIGSIDGQEHYDARTEPHAHFVCDKCHGISDIELSDTMDGIFAELEKNTGCLPKGYALTVNGICGDCAGK